MGGRYVINQRRRYGFVQVPNIWREQLRKVKACGPAYEIAMMLLDEGRWREWVTLALANVKLAARGISRRQKCYALKQLREAGLIVVEERGRRSPRIKPLFRER